MAKSIPPELIPLLANRTGLDSSQVEESKNRYGLNKMIEASPTTFWSMLKDALRDPMIWFLLGVSVVYLALNQIFEASILALAILPILLMDAILHRRTQASTASLAERLATQALVLRNGKEVLIPSLEVVPGDLIIVKAGEYFPADGVLLNTTHVEVDESSLTGESLPVAKSAYSPESPSTSNAIALENNDYWGLAGTSVLTGTAQMRVIHTSRNTMYGEVINLATQGSSEKTPLQLALAKLMKSLIIISVMLCVVLAVVRLYQGFGWLDALISSVTLAIAAFPEEFPIVYTFFLGVGVYRMAKRKALIRRAVAVENIGRTTCICSDKTGTITAGRLVLSEYVSAGENSTVEVLTYAAKACSPDSLDPLDLAILKKIADQNILNESKILKRFPFIEGKKRETVVIDEDKNLLFVVKGAPEAVFQASTLEEQQQKYWNRQVDELAEKGKKVIACAIGRIEAAQWNGDENPGNLQIMGLLAFDDPPREGVKSALQWCRQQGIHVVMLTGDHLKTAIAIGKTIGLGDNQADKSMEPRAILADNLTPEILKSPQSLRKIEIIARAVPSQKLALVRAFKEMGEVVAVTGDGVNDVPALQSADIAIAMGERGTRSAREVASIVLMDDNFGSIVRSIIEGRQLFFNLQQSYRYLLIIHFPLVITAALVPLAGYPLLFLPIHIVWLELLIHPTALLVFQQETNESVSSNKHLSSGTIFNRRQWLGIFGIGFLITVALLLTYHRSLGAVHENIAHARGMALSVLIAAHVSAIAGLTSLKTLASKIAFFASLISSAFLLQFSWFAKALSIAPLHTDDLIVALASGFIFYLYIFQLKRFSNK